MVRVGEGVEGLAKVVTFAHGPKLTLHPAAAVQLRRRDPRTAVREGKARAAAAHASRPGTARAAVALSRARG